MARDISHLLLGAGLQMFGDSGGRAEGGKPEIEFLSYAHISRLYQENRLPQMIAELYSAPLDLVETLAKDPDHGGKATVSSYIETMVALELERDGILGVTVGRGPSMSDLIDGWRRKWDVKAPPLIPGISFSFKKAIASVRRKFDEFPNGDIGILLCVSFLDAETYFRLQKELMNDLAQNELFRVRQITIEAFDES